MIEAHTQGQNFHVMARNAFRHFTNGHDRNVTYYYDTIHASLIYPFTIKSN